MKVLSIVFLLLINSYVYEGQIIKIYDGDSFKVLSSSGEEIECRLYGIDCLEATQNGSNDAKLLLRKLILNKNAKIVAHRYDIYNRQIVDLYVNGVWINKAMVEAGQAYVYHKYTTNRDLIEAETRAKLAKKGIWKTKNVYPWEHRKFNNNYKRASL